MKKKIFTLLTLALAVCSGAWAAEVTDLVTISNNYTFICDDFTSNGTSGLTNGTLYDNDRFLPVGNQTATTAASNKGSNTIDGVSHLNSLRLKNNQDQYAIKVSGPCSITFYTQSNSSRGVKVGSTKATGGSNTGDGCIEYGVQTASTSTWTCNVTAAGVVYIASYGGDFYFAGFKVVFPKPDITTQPVSATYQKDATATALTVAATASAGDLSYQWYSCEDANKSNAAVINGETSSSYTPSTATVGTFYYFCRVADTNGTTDSDVVTISVSEASAPTISIVASATTVYVGNAVNLTATVSGVPTPTIQWYSCTDAEKTNPAAIDGAINETYAPSTTTEGTYYYYAVATNSEGSATSDVITLTVNPLYTVTFSLGDATGVTGTVPSAVEVESAVTLPTNQTLYKEGYTLTGWNDGTTTYAAGTSATITANTTMTAVFTANTVELGVCPATITWQFQTGQGAPAWSHQEDAAFPYVAQMALGSETIDMALTMDASDGKIANANWTDWSQMNGGTKLTAPVVKGSVLKLYVYGEGSTPVTFNGTAGTYSSNIYSYTATAVDGTTGSVEIVIGDQSYTKYLTVEYPTVGVKVYDYATSVGKGVSGNSDQVSIAEQSINGTKVNVIKFNSSLSSDKATNYWKITPAAGKFQKGDRVIWTGCYSNSSTKTTTIAIYDDDAISSAIVTGENFANVYGGSASSPKSLTTGYFTLTADAEALYIGRSGNTGTYLTALTVVRENATIKPAYAKTTYVTTTALDFSDVAGLKAYRASDASAGKVTLDEVTTVPAGTPLLLIGTADTEYSVPALETADAIGTNLLVAGDGTTEFDGTTYDYILYSDGLFYQIGSGSVAVGKAYLHCESNPTAAGSRSLAISFGDETTGISSMHNSQCIMHNEIYNLSGQRVGQPVKGLYIVNGKKVLVK